MAYEPWLIGSVTIEEKFSAAERLMPEMAEALLWKLANRIREAAKMRVAIDTGALKASISISTWRRTDHHQRVSAARALRGEARFAPHIRPPRDTAYIHAAAHYATFQELGWHDRGGVFHPGQPYLVPALAVIKRELDRVFSTTWKDYQNRLPLKKWTVKP